MKRFVFILFLFVFLFPGDGYVLTINNENYSLQQFFSRYPKKQWERADSTQREKMLFDFTVRNLCILEASGLNFENDPDIAIKIRNQSHQILVNETYEQLVALPLIDPDDIDAARKFSKTELFINHILIGHVDSYLARPPERSIDEALVLSQKIKNEFLSGAGFSVLAEKYSDDPSAFQNLGSIGWVSWGSTVPEFQSVAFVLNIGEISHPIKTAYGYHLVLVTESRPSDMQYLSEEAYESAIINLSKGGIRDRLRGAALKYDSLKIKNSGVYFNPRSIRRIVRAYEHKQKEGSLSGGDSPINAADLLESVADIGVVCVYGGGGYGALWFANKMKGFPSSRQPILNSGDGIISVFRTIILQDIAARDGLKAGVDNSYMFKMRRAEMVSASLYDAYIKHLVSVSVKPDSLEIKKYYDENLSEKYLDPEEVVVRELRVGSRNLADSLLSLVLAGENFTSLIKEHSLFNPEKGGVGAPFNKNKNSSLFDAVSLLSVDEISPVLASNNSLFSIVQLLERIPEKPRELSLVYSRIESIIIKKNQDEAREDGTTGLLDKYKVYRHIDVLGW